MANWSTLKAAIANVIKTNGNQEITGALLQNTLNSIVNNIGENATFAGVAIPTTNPGAPDGPVFYFAVAAGTYSNFGGISLDGKSLCILITDKQQGWKSQEVLQLDKISPDLSEMLRRITGSSTNSSAYTDPFISLGNLGDSQELSSVLNTLYDNKYMGRCRAAVSGMNIEIYQFVHSLKNNAFSQIVLGNVVPSEDGTQIVIRDAKYFDIIARYHINDVWSEWKSVTKQNIPVVTASTAGLMSSADKTKLDGMPGAFVLDLGQVSSADVGDAMAARSEIAGNRNIFAIRYTTKGVSALKTTVIIQWCNGINESAQIKFVDKAQWRRNVTGATGVAGAPTNAFRWERTGAHYLGYDAANRKIQLKDYNQTAFRDVQLPLATTSQAGLMSSADKTKLDKYADTFASNPSASDTTSGLMSGTDKKNLERIILINQNILTLETNGMTSLTVPVSSSFTAGRLYEVLSSKYGRLVINIYYDLVWYNITPLYSFINTDGSELKFAWLNPTTGQYVLTTWKLGSSGENWLVSQAQF